MLHATSLVLLDRLELGLVGQRIRLSLVDELHLPALLNRLLLLVLLLGELLARLRLQLLLLLPELLLLQLFVGAGQPELIHRLAVIALLERLYHDGVEDDIELELVRLQQLAQLAHPQVRHELQHLGEGLLPGAHLAEAQLKQLEALRQAPLHGLQRGLRVRVVDLEAARQPVELWLGSVGGRCAFLPIVLRRQNLRLGFLFELCKYGLQGLRLVCLARVARGGRRGTGDFFA